MWQIVIILIILVLFNVAIYALVWAGAREDDMKAWLLKRFHEEMEKRGQDDSGRE